ncbi:Ultraviolet-B receptor UVR8 [Phytophthora citrophthora]|uniref:Ultraviolet-B receptor UVR8 n=1 Tax=Phytophthora citrophthora TaxID=4793 RepID=A0AAD9LSP5_9STRA|nr:Ultraviolet-B receptor UVR8 [Phytophthora citrophthora]
MQANGTGFEPRSVAPGGSMHRPDVRWGRLSLAQLRDVEFLDKQLRRIEITQGARRPGRSAAQEAATLTVDKTIRQRLVAAQSKASRGAEDEELDAKDETLESDLSLKTSTDEERHERELLNALCVLGDLKQPELAALMATKLKDALRCVCTFPNPIYQLIALRRQLMKNIHEAVIAQHRQRKAAMQLNVVIAKCMESSLLPDATSTQPADAAGLTGSGPIKPKEKVTREAVLGIQVLVCLLNDLHDPAVSTMTQRREFLEDLLPLLSKMEFLALSPRRNTGISTGLTGRSSPVTADIAEFTEKLQRFLLDMCPRFITISSTSPKLSAISSNSELDVQDRTNAVNGLIHLAAATGSVRDFLVVLRVLLGANEPDSVLKEQRSLSSRSLLTASVPSLITVRAEELLPTSGRDEAGAVRPDSIKPQKGSPLSKRETEILGDTAVQENFRRKTLPKGLKTITSSSTGSTSVNLLYSSSPHHRLLFGTPGNNLVRTKEEAKDTILLGNTGIPLDMTKMKEPLVISSRNETPVLTARCPKFKALNVQSILVELDQVKPCAPNRSSAKPNSVHSTGNSVECTEDEGDREVWSCGQNSYGELGHGDTASRKSFERIQSLQHKEIVQIGAGNEHTMALTADGKVLTCGYNDNGQCGQGGTARVSHLSEVPKLGDTGISQVHAYNGCEHTIFVSMDGRAATCGYNYRGQLGHGTTSSESVPKLIRSLENKVVRLVSCSYYHTVMACEEDGSGKPLLYTFGRNDYGQLGHNDSIDRKVPQHVEALIDQQVISVACGQYHTTIVTATGKAFAFGKNDYGQLGLDSMENQLVPVQIRSGLDKYECLEIRCGYYHTIVLCSGAHVFGFGRNDYGQLGLGRPNASSTSNLQLQQQRFSYARLIEELEGKDIVRFACGCYHTIAVSDNGVMYVFGRNNHGQLGTGDTNERVYPFPIDDFVGKRVALVAAGFYHTVVLTGGKEDEKNDQEAGGNEKTEAVPNGLTHTTILSNPIVQGLLNPNKRETIDSGGETPAIDPTVDDFRDEDSHFEQNSTTERPTPESVDALFVAVVIVAQLDRLCQSFIPKPGSYPAQSHPSMRTIEALVSGSVSSSSCDVSGGFEGSFETFGVHNCSSTFESIAVLLKHLSTRKLDYSSPFTTSLVQHFGTPRRVQPNQIQMYLLLACIRILQANISQILRSGMAKTIILLSTETGELKPWAKELDRSRVAILKVREVLLSLIDIKYRKNCFVLDNIPNDGENATQIAEEATTTLMQGFELFFPCECLQRQFCMHTMHETSSNVTPDQCGTLCRRELWSIDTLPRSKNLLLEPLLRRIAEDSLIVRFLPLGIGSQEVVAPVTEIYHVLLERIGAGFTRRLGEAVARSSLDGNYKRETTLRAFYDALGGVQKHLFSWAASVHEWILQEEEDKNLEIEEQVAVVVDRVFRVDEEDFERVPSPWRCCIEFSLAATTQCCEVLGQVFSMESLPSPTHMYDQQLNLEVDDLHLKMLEVVEHSIVGQFLPLLVVSLFEFSNNPLFAAALLPSVKTLLRLLDVFNRQDTAVIETEKRFVDNVAMTFNQKGRKSESSMTTSAREDDGKTRMATFEAMALPWIFRLEKELAVLAAEMAVTLTLGNPSFNYQCVDNEKDKISDHWLSSSLFRGGLSAKYLTRSIRHGGNQLGADPSNHARIVQHTPFSSSANLPVSLTIDSRQFSLVLPPSSGISDTNVTWKLPTEENYAKLFRPDVVREFLASLQGKSPEKSAIKLCDWVRDSYAKKNPAYRMLMRQAQLSMNLKATDSVENSIHENDVKIEISFFAALLHHNLLGSQACHFALGLDSSVSDTRPSPPRFCLSLWQCVAQLRRRIAAKKTDIKNTPNSEVNSPRASSLERILSIQRSILDRCKLLLLVDVHEEQEHLNVQLDAGYIAPCDPAYLVSASSLYRFSTASAKRHLHSTYTDEKLPLLVAFPSSKWRKLRILLHTTIRWKYVATEFRQETSKSHQEMLAYILSDEALSSTSAIKTLLVDPCRRVSCSIRGLETLWELLSCVSFDSIQVDIAHQFSQVFAFYPSSNSIMDYRNVGYFYSSLQADTFSNFVGQLTEMMTDKAAVLMEGTDATSTFWIVIELLSAWGIHFNTEQFEFVSDIGILGVIQEMLQGISSKKITDTTSDTSPSLPSMDSIISRNGQLLSQLPAQHQISRLEDTLWILFRYICVHFAVQNGPSDDIYVPTFPVLSGIVDLLYTEAVSISNPFLALQESDKSQEEPIPVTPVAVRRSFEAITLPKRFSTQSKGVTVSYEDMISPCESDTTTSMSPLLKSNEFSITTWLYINSSPPRTIDGDMFDLPSRLQERQFIFMRGTGREIALYLVLVPESIDNWQLEMGILMDFTGSTESAVKGRMWERVLTKQAISGGKWIHVAVVLEPTKLRLYLNGILDSQRSLAAQSIPIWGAGSVDLPLHFGRFPTEPAPPVASAVEFLSRSLGILKDTRWDPPSNNARDNKTGAFRCFDGWLSHFRFHNRSLSPIHVRIVFDEKKSPPLLSLGTNDHSKLVELHALLVLLSSSSEGLVHFTSQFSRWMKLIWGTFVGSNSVVVQQSALRVLGALLPVQSPLEASKVLIEDADTDTLGFYILEDIFIQQVIRIIGFCLSNCSQGKEPERTSDTIVQWPLMIPCGIHASQFSPESRDETHPQTELHNDIELHYQSSKCQSLMLANELNQLLQQLHRCSNSAWRESISRVTLTVVQKLSSSHKDPEVPEPGTIQFGKYALSLTTIRNVESVGCFYFIGGGVEFLRPGVKVEMKSSRDFAQVLSLDQTANLSPPETSTGTKVQPQVANTLAYVRIDSNPSFNDNSEASGGGWRLKNPNNSNWYETVFGSNAECPDTCPSYSKVNIDELIPVEATNPNGILPSIIYDTVFAAKILSVLVEKAGEVIPDVYNGSTDSDLVPMNVGCMLMKILVQIAGTKVGIDELLSKPALVGVITELAVKPDINPNHETLFRVEKRVSALRREVYTALVDLGEEAKAELENLLDSSKISSVQSVNTPPLRELNRDDLFVSRRSITQAESEILRISDTGLENPDDEPANENWDPAQGDDQESEDDEGEDDDEDEDGSLEDNDEDEEDETDETRAELVEELMLMGFPEDWCVLALKQTENDIVAASAWIVDNLEYLSKLQSTLDKERDKGRDSPRFDEEEDDVVPSEDLQRDSRQPPSLNSSNSWIHSAAWRENDETSSSVKPDSGNADDTFMPPPLNDKEMGRKLFGEMYFPFEDGGFLSNTKSRFMTSWRADAVEMKENPATSTQPIVDNTPKVSGGAFEEDFQTEINKLDLRGLFEQLRQYESTLSILYARQCVTTLLHQTVWKSGVESLPSLMSYAQWFKLLKLVLLRGDQFAIVSRATMSKTSQLQEFSVDDVFSRTLRYFVDHDGGAFTPAVLEFCLDELEAAASSKAYEAVLWTQRNLQRPDRNVVEEPGIEVVIWLLDALLAGSRSLSFSLPTGLVKTVLHRLRCCLGTANLPLKFVVLRTISRMLIATGIQADDVVKDSQLIVGEFLTAAIMRYSRELGQGRLLFSQYLQGYVELLHVLQNISAASKLAINPSQSLVSSLPLNSDGCSLLFDRKRSRSSLLAFAEDNFSVSYSGNEVWKAACASVGFSTGVHSWIVRIEKSSSPYLFVGVATRQANLDSFLGADDQSWGFIGDKALYYQRNRVRSYGETFTEGDCIGLRLDCEKGELSFSKNGVDLGMAFDNVVGEVCPAVAFYSRHQKLSFIKESCVSFSGNDEPQIIPTGEDGNASVEDCLIACEIMSNWITSKPMRAEISAAAFKMTAEWLAGSTKFVTTRSDKSLWVDVTKETCGKLGFHSDDRVRTPRGNGVVLGTAGGRIWVEVDNEPGAWFFHPSKLRVVAMASSVTTGSASPIEANTLLSARNDSTSVLEGEQPSFTLSSDELVEFGEHSLWRIAVDRDLLNIVNDFCEVSRISPWNLTPSQLLNLIKEKTPVLEQTSVSCVLSVPSEKLEKMVIARFALLRFCNMYVRQALPFFDLTWHYFLPDSNSLPCRLISQCRGSLFVCVKNVLWTALMERTANSPKKADDEYDYPEDLPQLQVNRLKAAASKCHEGTVSSLFLSLFGQAFEELHFLPLKTLRMVYSHPMDDGQLRSFKVKFEGEGVDDYGGPYREFFSQFFAELQMLHVPETEKNENQPLDHSANGGPSSTSMKLDPNISVSECVLPFLMPSPNWRNGVGANREKFVLNGALINRQGEGDKLPKKTVRCPPGESAEEKRQLYCEMFHFFGQMIGTCLRTRVCVRLDLAMSVWKQFVAEDDSNAESALETLKEIDFVAYSLWKTLKGILDEFKRLQVGESAASKLQLEEQLEAMDLVFTTVLSDGRTLELCENGSDTAVTLINLEKYLDAMLQARVEETQEVVNIVKQGLHSIMPVSALQLLTWTELEKRMCGVAEVDVKLLQANTEYDEELSPNDEFIQRFWRVLESLESEDKRAFLRFVWARSRLPLGSAQFHQKFKIQALASSGAGDGSTGSTATNGGWMDSQMPKSHTCFFALQLPRYSSDDICRERLLYAVRNCVEMDGDFRLADTEMTGWTGISATDQLRI